MSVTRSFQATFQIVNLTAGAGGTGVAVWRDTANNYLYIATAYHVVEGMAEGMFVDYTGRKYTTYNYIVLDKTYDFALVEVRGVPTSIPTVILATRSSAAFTYGADLYVIGWPLLMDTNSVSSGALRSPRWNANGTMNQLLISAPVFGGNSGGGVFLKSTHELIGVVSWGLVNDETINGIVPFTAIAEALYYFMYRPSLATPALTCGESYMFGVQGFLIDPFTMQYWLQPTHPSLTECANVGMIVTSVLPTSPASAAGFMSLTNTGGGKYTFDIVWGVRRAGSSGAFTFINEENALDSILYSYCVTANHGRRRMLVRRSRGEAANAALDIVLPTSLQIECLTSRVVNDVPDNNFVVKPVTLVKRAAYYAAAGSGGEDPSTFGNEFLFGKRNDLRTTVADVRTYSREFIKVLTHT